MADESEWRALPTEDKCVHKAWKARVAGYEEACQKFPTLEAKSPEFSKFLGIIKKFAMDSNAIAQEKGLDAVLLFVENAHQAGRTAGEVLPALITKCLNSSRVKTKEKAMEAVLMYVEIDKQEAVVEELLKGLENKQPKIVAGCVRLLTLALENFGSKVIALKPIVKSLPKLLEDRDKTVREEAKMLAVEIFRWIRAALRPQLSSLKPVQVQELEAEFERMPPGKPTQTRFMRSQQDLKEKAEAASAATGPEAAAAGDAPGQEVEAEVDPYEFMTAVEVLTKLPKNFYEQIEAKKWQERKEVLDVCHKLCESPKISPGDYGDLVHALKKVVTKDTNVMLVTIATKCLHGLAIGLRKKFQPYATSCVKTYLEKFKEKKATVVAALRDAIDSASQCMTSLEPVQEELVLSLESKNPSIKAETASFLARSFTRAKPATLTKKLLKLYCVPLCKTINDTTPDVREASFTALGTAMKVVGEKILMPFLGDIDALKLAKVKECCEKAELVYMKGQAVSQPAAKTEAKPVERPKTAGPSKSGPRALTSKRPTTAPAKSSGAGGKGPGAGPAKGKKKPAGAAVPVEPAISDEEAQEKTSALVGAETYADLSNMNYKLRLAAMESIKQVCDRTPSTDVPIQALVRSVAKKPGLKDTNFQVLKLRMGFIAQLAGMPGFSRTSADVVLPQLIDKIGDNKNGADAKETLTAISEAIGLIYVSDSVVPMAFEQKNPKNTSETMFWLARAIEEFGLKVSVKSLVVYVKKALEAPNPTVRSVGVKLVGVLRMYVGPDVRTLFEDCKPSVLQLIDTEIEKMKDTKPSAPFRGVKKAAEEGQGDIAEEGEGQEEEDDTNELIPRSDISDKITDGLLEKMSDKNWKIRKEGLEEVQAIFQESKFVTGNLGGLPEALKKRMADSNKLLVGTTLTIFQTMAKACGRHAKKHVGVVGGAIVSAMSDNKAGLRQSAVNTLDAWVAETKLPSFVTENVFSEALAVENPNLRSTLLGWLSKILPDAKKLPAAELRECLPPLLACLSDRNGDVRKSAQEALTPFMIHTGYDAMVRAAGKLGAGNKEQTFGLLEKARGNLPAKPTKAPVPAQAAASDAPKVDISDLMPKKAAAVKEDVTESGSGGGGSGGGGTGKTTARGKPKAAPAKAAPSKKKGEEVDTSPLMSVTVTKQQRMKDEKNLKVLKWNFTTPRAEVIEQLKDQMEKNCSKPFMDNLFHTDFQKHIKAIQQMSLCLENFRAETVENLDLVLKWFTLRFYDTNPSMLNKALEFLQNLFSALHELEYQLPESEASAFIPYLILKVGDSKENVRGDVRKILKRICNVYPASKMFVYVMGGLASKNSKQRTECLDELGCLIRGFGINVCKPSPGQALKEIAKQIGDRDNSVRNAALNTVVTAHEIMGDGIFKVIGRLSDKDKGMLEERIKRTASKPKAAAPPSNEYAAPPIVREQPPPAAEPEPTKPVAAVSPRPAAPPVSDGGTKPLLRHIQMDYWPEVTCDLGDAASLPPPVMSDQEPLPEIPPPDRSTLPPKILFQFLQKSSDANVAISSVISQIAHNDPERAQLALSQIDDVLKCSQRSALFSDHIDQLLIVFTVQTRMILSKHLPNIGAPSGPSRDQTVNLMRSLIAALVALADQKEVIKKASRDILSDLLQVLMQLTISDRVQDNPKIIASLNLAIAKLIENSHATHLLCAMVGLLHSCLGSYSASGEYVQLLMRALWKATKLLPRMVSSGELDPAIVMRQVLAFFQTYPNQYWAAGGAGKGRGGEMPLRTMKTLVFSLVREYKTDILQLTAHIEGLKGSNLEHYINKCLSQGAGVEQSAKKHKRDAHDKLTEIFKKIGSKEMTREGLNELYDFKQRYPEADMEPFVRESSQFFQTYIEKGLQMIAEERKANKSSRSPAKETTPQRASGGLRPGAAARPAWACGEDCARVVGGQDRLDEILELCRKHNIPDIMQTQMDHGELTAWAEDVIAKHGKKAGVLTERRPHTQSDISMLESNVQGRTPQLHKDTHAQPHPSASVDSGLPVSSAPRQQTGDRRSQQISKTELASLQAKLNKIKSNR